MRAMILAAGLGTRLRPLTDSTPKALVELGGRTLLEITIARLKSFHVAEIIINTHHFSDQVVAYLQSKNNFDVNITISCEDELLDTGGGLQKAAWFFTKDPARLDEPFLLHNVDILTNIDLFAMQKVHAAQNAAVTLAVQSRDTSRPLLFDSQNQLAGRISGRGALPELVRPSAWQQGSLSPAAQSSTQDTSAFLPKTATKPASAAEGLHPLAFSGIHLISPRLLPQITESGIFSIIPTYLRLAATQTIRSFRADQYYWRDLGRPADLTQAALDLQNRLIR